MPSTKSRFLFTPRLLTSLKGYGRGDLTADLIAGITVGLVALPLAMAFAIASGLSPAVGLHTAIIAGFLISALGGSRVQIGGPTGAFVVIVFGILAEYGPEKLAVCTLMAGGMLLIMGFARMGTLIRYIPYPVTMGFTAGIAVLILSSQVKDFLGLDLESVPSDFPAKLAALASHLHTLHLPTLLLACSSLAVLTLWPKRWARVVPPSIVVLIVGALAVRLAGLEVDTIGSRFGDIPGAFPAFRVPQVEWNGLGELIKPAVTIALLAAIESLLSAVVADGMTGDRHDSNQELMAQGIANIASPLFGGMPATGAIARTATNIRAGARSPVSGIIHALTLLIVMWAAAPLASFIPLASLSAVLVLVAINMGEWHLLTRLPRWPKSDGVVYLASLLLTVWVDLTVAVEVGMVLASLLFIKRVSETSRVALVEEESDTEAEAHSVVGRDLPPGVAVFEIRGSFSFGVADRLETVLHESGNDPQVLLLRMRAVLAMDATGLNALEDLHEKLQRKHRHLVLVAPHAQPLLMMDKAGFLDTLGRDHLCGDLDEALNRVPAWLNTK